MAETPFKTLAIETIEQAHDHPELKVTGQNYTIGEVKPNIDISRSEPPLTNTLVRPNRHLDVVRMGLMEPREILTPQVLSAARLVITFSDNPDIDKSIDKLEPTALSFARTIATISAISDSDEVTARLESDHAYIDLIDLKEKELAKARSRGFSSHKGFHIDTGVTTQFSEPSMLPRTSGSKNRLDTEVDPTLTDPNLSFKQHKKEVISTEDEVELVKVIGIVRSQLFGVS